MSNIYNNLQKRQQVFVDSLVRLYGKGDGNYIYGCQQIISAAHAAEMLHPPTWVINDQKRCVARGFKQVLEAEFSPVTQDLDAVEAFANRPARSYIAPKPQEDATVNLVTEKQRLVPTVNPNYVAWGNHSTVRAIIKSGVFYPTWINGLSGNGKTLMVQQVCAKEGRECFRVNITEETDEDDLLGGYRLKDGNTVWQDGPVVEAMNRGAVLLLDELDLGSFKIMCLQPILEGSGVFLKKVGRFVKPEKGFTVFATANTKGQGSDDGRFVGTRVQNEALLERFKATIEQPYASIATEISIITRECASLGIDPSVAQTLAENLSRWADGIRKQFVDGHCEDVISTRRISAIVQGFAIFGDIKTAMTLALARFPEGTREGFTAFYDKLVAVEVAAVAAAAAQVAAAAAAAANASDLASSPAFAVAVAEATTTPNIEYKSPIHYNGKPLGMAETPTISPY